jgi:hypothetical protein
LGEFKARLAGGALGNLASPGSAMLEMLCVMIQRYLMNIFIDTNIWLDFYHLSKSDLEELRKIEALIEYKELNVYLPANIKDEFLRNRETKIADAMKHVKEAKYQKSFPTFLKDYPEYLELQQKIKECSRLHNTLEEKAINDIENETLLADQVISEIFSKSILCEHSDSIYEAALKRSHLRQPPGKNNSIGDAINWITLLEKIPQTEQLHLISGDGDFSSALDNNKLSSYLKKEWELSKFSTIFYYTDLSQFFKKHFPSVNLADDFVKKVLIKRLKESYSFDTTHSIVSRLLNFESFTPIEKDDIISAYVDNSQVYWIRNDYDLLSLKNRIIAENTESLDQDLLIQLNRLYR